MVAGALRPLILLAVLGWLAIPAWAQAKSAADATAATTQGEMPLPDIPTLMREVMAHQKESESIRKNYLYRSVISEQELDGHGNVRKTTTEEYDVFWVQGVPVSRLMRKNGKDLTQQEIQKENNKIDKAVAKAKEKIAKATREGKPTDAAGNELITVSRLLALLRFTNPRRVKLNGRDTIEMDYAGDPNAKPQDRAESVFRDLAGTAWIDEQDRVLVKAEGRVVDNFKLGAGLLANIRKGASFQMQQTKVNGEVWLPSLITAQGSARFYLLFHFNGKVREVDSDYRKFKATSTILPNMGVPISQ